MTAAQDNKKRRDRAAKKDWMYRRENKSMVGVRAKNVKRKNDGAD